MLRSKIPLHHRYIANCISNRECDKIVSADFLVVAGGTGILQNISFIIIMKKNLNYTYKNITIKVIMKLTSKLLL